MAVDLAKAAKERNIKYFLISFVDLFGVLRAKLVPARAIGAMQKDGAGFAGFDQGEDDGLIGPDFHDLAVGQGAVGVGVEEHRVLAVADGHVVAGEEAGFAAGGVVADDQRVAVEHHALKPPVRAADDA